MNGPIGIGVAVVRGNELYVATIGPAEAYLIRQARLSTLPDPHRERGLPTEGPRARRLARRDQRRRLARPRSRRTSWRQLGADELKDAMVTLHPQPAMEHLHHRFIAADGIGSDAMIALEATEVASTHKSRALVPVRPAEPLAGAPDRSPIPLADNVTDGVAAVQASAGRARAAAGGAFERLVARLQDAHAAPPRGVSAGHPGRRQARDAAASCRRDPGARRRDRRAWAGRLPGGGGQAAGAEPRVARRAGEAALKTARAGHRPGVRPGVDLVDGDPSKAIEPADGCLSAARHGRRGGELPASTIAPLRKQARRASTACTGRARRPRRRSSRSPTQGPLRHGHMILGPDGAPFVLDRATKSVYRIDPRTKKATVVFREGHKAPAGPRRAEVHRRRRPRPPDRRRQEHPLALAAGRHDGRRDTTTRSRPGSAGWGDDIMAIGTFLGTRDRASTTSTSSTRREQQILAYSPAATAAASRPPNRPARRRRAT